MCGGIVRTILAIVNIIVGIIAAVILIFGAILTWSKDMAVKVISSVLHEILQKVDPNDTTLGDKIATELLNFCSNYGLVLFIFGAIIFCICVLGCVGACCKVSIIMIIYLALISAIVLVHAVLLIIYFTRKDIPASMLGKQLENLVMQYQSLMSKDGPSLTLGLLMPRFNCCGFKNGDDFKTSTNFKRTDGYDGKIYSTITYPIPCCKMDNAYKIIDATCPQSFTKANSNFDQGCEKPFEDMVLHYLDLVAYVSIGILLFNVLLIVFGVLAITC